MQVELYPRIVADSEIFSGRPIIAGTHALVSTLIREVAAGKTVEDVAHGHALSPDDVRAALEYAATRTDEAISLSNIHPNATSAAFAAQLDALRAQIVATGDPLLSWDEVAAEVAERRSERYRDEQA